MLAPALTAAVLAHVPTVLAADTPAKKSGNPILTFAFLGIAVLGLVFVVRRGRRQKALIAEQQEQGLAIGATVVTRGGLVATLVEKGDDELVLEIAPGVRARFVPQAILRVQADPEPETGPAVPSDPGATADRADPTGHADGAAPADGDRLAD